jgi:hypothetical protein
VLDEFHPVPATTEVNEANLVSEGLAEHTCQGRIAAASERSVVERKSSILNCDDDLSGSAEDVNVVPPFLFRLVGAIDDVAADCLDCPTEVLSIRIIQSELVSSPTHKVDHGGQECGVGQDCDTSHCFLGFRCPARICHQQYLFTGLKSASKGLEVAYLSSLAFKLVAKLWVGDTYELAGPLSDAAAAKLGHAVLGDDAVHHVLEGRNRRARM